MSWELDKNRPLCPQISEQLCVMIAGGALKPNERLLSVREVALQAGVNPNTVQKAFEQLEQTGLIFSVRGSGWYVGENTAAATETVEQLKQAKTAHYFADMMHLGVTPEAVKQFVKEWNG